MNKRQLTEAIAQRSNLTRQEARLALEALVDVVAETLARGDDVVLRNFGRFEVHELPPYSIRHVRTRQPQLISGVRLPVFKSSAALRRRLRKET